MKIEFAWKDETHLLHLPEMDATHREFVDLLLRAQRAPDGELAQCLDSLLDHTRAHFKHESGMMSACGLSSRAEHEAEHQRILGELGRMRARAEGSRTAFVRAYLVEAVPDWFRTHLATMDSDLAAKYRQAFP
ncbi:bacteriohemerythrin [Sulfurimicrobium lacus]|nr:hemerythrin domain-containing protein [Sulfurimicrobium lacus]